MTYTFHREANKAGILDEGGRTPARNQFWAVTTELDALRATVFYDGYDGNPDAQQIKDEIKTRNARIDNDFSGPWAISVEKVMVRWQVVMQVTAVEVYLQDVLAHWAYYDPDLLRGRDVRQEWNFDEVWDYTEVDSMLRAFCVRWAKGFVQDGGPRAWRKRLEKFGARGYVDADTEQMEVMWGMRHMVVHHSGRFTHEFMVRHPVYAERIYNEGLTLATFHAWRDASQKFVDTTDQFVGATLMRKLGAETIRASQELQFENMMQVMNERFRRRETEPSNETSHESGVVDTSGDRD